MHFKTPDLQGLRLNQQKRLFRLSAKFNAPKIDIMDIIEPPPSPLPDIEEIINPIPDISAELKPSATENEIENIYKSLKRNKVERKSSK